MLIGNLSSAIRGKLEERGGGPKDAAVEIVLYQ